ncbi:MAG: hypothetical protein PHO70_02535 [Candidatus Omnitrophica bacterium]|nr:hypothetical protein [Candidatus Omnitrophota bacterium]
MTEQNNSGIEKWQLVVGIINTFCICVATVFGGIYLKAIESKIELSQKRVQTSVNVIDLINDIMPKIEFNVDKEVLKAKKTIEIRYNCFNSGKYAVTIEKPEILLSDEAREINLSEKSYRIIAERMGTLYPTQRMSLTITVIFSDSPSSLDLDKVISSIVFKYHTDNQVLLVAKELLKDFAKPDIIDELGYFSTTQHL